MKYLGLISLLLIVGVGAWVATQNVSAPSETSEADSDKTSTKSSTYADTLNAAREAADALSGGGIEVYDGITVSRNATELDLSGRGFEGSLKAEVRQLSQLQVLDLSDNNFTGLPAEVGQLSQLQILNLSNNPFTGLPYELGNLQRLQTLDLRGTNYAEADLANIEASLPSTTVILK